MNNKNTPATKKDIENLATKAELKALEQKLTGKIDAVEQKLTGRIDSLAIELAKTQADVREIRHEMSTKVATKDDISRIMNAIDAFAAESYPTATATH